MFQTLRGLSQSLSFTLMSVDIWKVSQAITLTNPSNFALENIALNQLPGGPDGPDLQGPVPVTQLHPDVHGLWKVFQTITLTHPNNFALVNIALNQLPGGPDGPDPPVGAGAAGVHLGGGQPFRSSSGGQDKAIWSFHVLRLSDI